MSSQELIICPICFEKFNKPRYLPCLHTYCEDCLADYISSSYKEEEGGFVCPTCRSVNQVQISEGKSAKTVATSFPINHLIVTLLDQHQLEEKEVTCQPCAKRGKSESGKFWCYSCSAALCEACGEFHTSLPILADHRIAPIDDSKDTSMLASSVHDHCDVHTGKKLEMFCEDHDVACCATCTMVHHRKCETVLTLQDAAKKSFDKDNNIDSEIEMLIQKIDTKVDILTKNYDKLEKDSETRGNEIQEFSDKLIKHLVKLKTEFETKVSETRDTTMQMIQERKQALIDMQTMLSHSEDLLQAAEEKCSKVQLLTLLPKISKLRDESRCKLEEMKKTPITLDSEVIIDKAIEQCATIETLGKLE
ncbi:E3 ubiquitin-protein ligase TRIM56-like [Saccostrea echinata]|uniref:E3 ubiquitin-protein ligase TRIM56-like n=1 Tax=Saccostrea echinata TaxID=191078 RepID=UPI002A8410BA|nr:E3 ubiquitin-protein ligase TRIM56-like [Saccostrea echinata]